jgi:protein SCO1/2
MLALLLLAGDCVAARKYAAEGLVLKIDRAHKNLVVSCDAIPGFMDAMVMPIGVRDAKTLHGLTPGMTIAFTLVVEAKDSYAIAIREVRYQGSQPDPTTARRLDLLNQTLNPDAANAKQLNAGETVPDFTLTDQNRQKIALSKFRGKVIALNFIYTRCALPNYCFRMSNNFGELQKRFRDQLGNNLVLLTVTFDPVHDRPEALAKYAAIWKADPRSWHFLTGETAEVTRVCAMFGITSFPDEGLMDHSLHTAVIDRKGRLVANIEGNRFTARELGDMVNSVLAGSK